MTNEQKKKEIAGLLDKIYKECGCDYNKYVLKIEELERRGEIRSEFIPRDNSKNIWNDSQ